MGATGKRVSVGRLVVEPPAVPGREVKAVEPPAHVSGMRRCAGMSNNPVKDVLEDDSYVILSSLGMHNGSVQSGTTILRGVGMVGRGSWHVHKVPPGSGAGSRVDGRASNTLHFHTMPHQSRGVWGGGLPYGSWPGGEGVARGCLSTSVAEGRSSSASWSCGDVANCCRSCFAST